MLPKPTFIVLDDDDTLFFVRDCAPDENLKELKKILLPRDKILNFSVIKENYGKKNNLRGIWTKSQGKSLWTRNPDSISGKVFIL